MTTSEREMEIRMKIADDKVYGEVRAEICDEYIAAGKPQPEKNWLYSKLVTLRLEHRDLERTFDLTWAAQMRAVEVWRKANPGNDLVLPDHQKLVEFLIDQLDEARKMLGELLTRSYAQAPNRDDELKWVCLECATSPWTDTLEECRRSHNESCVAGKAERVLKEGK